MAIVKAATTTSPATPLTLRCFICGMHRQIEDDGRRVRHAKMHVAACTGGPGADAESHLSLVSGDRLEVKMANGALWFEVARGILEDAPTPQETVQRFYRDWYVAVLTGPEGYATAFASDAAIMPPTSPPVVGRQAIQEWRSSQAEAAFRVLPESAVQDDIRIEGAAAFVRTTVRGRRVPRAGGEEEPFEEKYLDLLRRTPEGGWEFVARMWNSNL